MSATKTVLKLLSAACITAISLNAAAQARPDYGPDINLATAKKIAAGAVAECRNNKWNVAVAIVDTRGMLIYYERIDNTQSSSADIAIMKARAAATYRRTTRDFLDAINKSGPATIIDPKRSLALSPVPAFLAAGFGHLLGNDGAAAERCTAFDITVLDA